MRGLFRLAGAACVLSNTVNAINLNLNSTQSIKDAAATVAFGLFKYYTGNNTGDVAGNLPSPYFWWEAGAMFGTMVDYWFLTKDDSYNAATTEALLHQVGTDQDFMPANQTRALGNDDQGFWALAAMSAAENNYPNPPADQPQWLALAQAVFNEYTWRWDNATCNGGLRWQIFTFNSGFTYKNSISNGCFFNLGARLARYTGNTTYSDWATKVWNWEESVGLLTPAGQVYDGASVDGNCTGPNMLQWTYNAGIYLHGAATMYNITKDNVWKERVNAILNETISHFFNSSVMFEYACENVELCNTDQLSFKGYLLRWLAGTTQMVPDTFDTIMPLIRNTASAAARACTGSPTANFKGIPGTACGFKWTTGGFDNNVGVGQQMNALSAIMYTMVDKVITPVTAGTGGTSAGNVNAGQKNQAKIPEPAPITTGDRVAAGFLTVAIAMSVVGGSLFVVI